MKCLCGKGMDTLGKDNRYCPNCKSHFWEGEWWTATQWRRMINQKINENEGEKETLELAGVTNDKSTDHTGKG